VSVAAALARIVGQEHVRTGSALRPFLHDATEARNLRGRADAAALPATPEEVAAIVSWCHDTGTAVVPRGGGTGYAGGCVPDGGVVIGLERLRRVRALDPLEWRMQAEAGVTTRDVQRLAGENGLFFPPNPGAAEQSQLGGNIATNAGGPRAFKYGVTGAWITGIEAVLAPGRIVSFGGPVRKDVAGYDLVHLLVGSEGTLGIVTAAWLRLIPPPAARYPIVALYPDAGSGCAAVAAAMASGTVPSLIEYLDGAAVEIARGSCPLDLPPGGPFMLLCEADGDEQEAERGRGLLLEALSDGALTVVAPPAGGADQLWRWRETVPTAVDAFLGGKVSEDIVVPIERLAEAIERTHEIGARHGIRACSWGHAGDGNLHSSFLFDRNQPDRARSAQAAAEELFSLALELGGSISGEHGLGLVKSGHLAGVWSPQVVEAQRAVRAAFDPDGLMNPGKKMP
jgi:glycolate oxidase subunit GlcD